MARKKMSKKREAANAIKYELKLARELHKARNTEAAEWVKNTRTSSKVIDANSIDLLFANRFEELSVVMQDVLGPLKSLFTDNSKQQRKQRLNEILKHLLDVSQRLVDKRYVKGLWFLTLIPWVESLESWQPHSKSIESQFKSLVNHLVVKYKMADFMYSVFHLTLQKESDNFIQLFAEVAQGQSLYKSIKKHLPVVMTKKMTHVFFTSDRGFSVFYAMRYAQLAVLGADSKLIRAITATDLGRGFMADEEFWLSVMQWFCNQQPLEVTGVGPLIDYIRHCKHNEVSFSIKGRSVKAMLRGMYEWHKELEMHRKLYGVSYKACGIKSGSYQTRQNVRGGNYVVVTWSIEEILNSKQLVAEGRNLSHCVASYSNQIEIECTSIWSLKRDGVGTITIEVRNGIKTIVQARGKYNRLVTEKEKGVIKKWAAANSLDTTVVYW